MKGFGIFLIIMGLGSFVLNMMGREFALLAWIDTWGATPGIAIRLGLAALGVVLIVIGKKQEA